MVELSGKLYLEYSDLTDRGALVNTLDTSCKRFRDGKSQSYANIKHPQDARRTLIDYDTLPAATLRKFEVPAKDVLVRQLIQERQEALVQAAELHQVSLPASVQVDTQELSWLLKQPIDRAQAHGLARLAGWLKLLLNAKPKQCLALGFGSKEALYDAALEYISSEFDKKVVAGQRFNNKLVLKRKVQAYKNDGVQGLLSKRAGVKNAKKMLEMQENLLVQLFASPTKPDYEVVCHLLNESSRTYGWPELSVSTCKVYLNQPEVKKLWFMPRHGAGAYRNVYDPIISREAPSMANALWVLDGTPLELYFREGKSAHNRFEIFVVLDAHSWKIVGYAMGRSENSDLVRRALQMACRNEGYAPHQIQSDNGSAIKGAEIQQIIGKISTYYTPAAVGNARTKIVEPFFKHLNKKVLKYNENYSGSNVTAKSLDSHINPDAAQANMRNFPEANEAMEQVHLAIATWNALVGWKGKKQSIEQVYEASLAASSAKQRPFTEAMEVDAFYHMPAETYRYTNRGFDITFRKERYQFDVEDATFRGLNIGARFQVKFDPERMDALYLYQMDRLVVRPTGDAWVARPKTLAKMALVDYQEGDGQNLARLRALKDEQLETTQAEFAARVEALPEELKVPITLERVHKTSMNDVRRNLKKLESSGQKTIPMPVIQAINLYGEDDSDGPMAAIN